MQKTLILSAIGALIVSLPLQAQANQTVHHTTATLGSVAGQYPIFTPSNGNTVRHQMLIPGSFLDSALFKGGTKSARIVTRIGFQIAGQEDYTTFVVRVGVSRQTSLSTTWTTNLPDQRVQVDQSGTKLLGGLSGSAQANKWVYYNLSYPFLWNPGQNICIDVTAKSKVAGKYCRTARDTSTLRIPRVLHTSYTNQTTASTSSTSGGIMSAFTFEALGRVIEGAPGCAGASGVAPKLTATGVVKDPSVITVNLGSAPKNASVILAGGIADPVSRFGDCTLHTSAEVLIFGKTNATGASSQKLTLVKIPKGLKGFVIHLQWAVNDKSKKSPLPFTVSSTGKLILP